MPLADSGVLQSSGADAIELTEQQRIDTWVERGYGRRL
jgi:hypothetical protein